METFRYFLIAALCLILVSCASPVPDSQTQTTVPDLPDKPLPAQIEPSQPVGDPDQVENIIIYEVAQGTTSVWGYLAEAQNDPITRDAKLLNAAALLVSKRRNLEAAEILGLIDTEQLNVTEKIDWDILQVKLLQASNQHRIALRTLTGLERGEFLDRERRVRVIQLKILSYSKLDRSVDMVREFKQLYTLVSNEADLQLQTGHQLWTTLLQLTTDELREVLSKTENPITREWIVLALALGLDSVRVDPYKYDLALRNWQQENPEHPANTLIESGIATAPFTYSKIVLLLPLTSVNGPAAQAFRDGFLAQHEANSNPQKPQVETIDIGDQPGNATQAYYQAVDSGAEFIVGPLGIANVNEMAQYADFIVPTLLLGEPSQSLLPDHVYQFALAPEHDGIEVAQRAWQDGHVSGVVIKSGQQWSQRTTDAFMQEWARLGGQVINIYDYELDKSDYSDAAKQILLIDASVNRYQEVKALLGKSMNFVPRRRQDADFILLIADSKHGRLLKPYLDFLKAHDLPIYSTSRIFSGSINKIRDQDLNGVRFADMDWIIDRSDRMSEMRKTLEANRAPVQNVQRLFAMGVDTYNAVSRIEVLQDNPGARFHGVTSIIRLAEDRRLLRNPRWAIITDGIPELIPGADDPEQTSIPPVIHQFLPIALQGRSE